MEIVYLRHSAHDVAFPRLGMVVLGIFGAGEVERCFGSNLGFMTGAMMLDYQLRSLLTKVVVWGVVDDGEERRANCNVSRQPWHRWEEVIDVKA